MWMNRDLCVCTPRYAVCVCAPFCVFVMSACGSSLMTGGMEEPPSSGSGQIVVLRHDRNYVSL